MRPIQSVIALALPLLAAAASPAVAQAPGAAALVEDVTPGIAGVEAFDYVPAGKRIVLGSGGKLTLGYLASCVEETITGGTVTVGSEQSTVAEGSVQRKTVACAGRPLQLSAEQSGKSGGIVFRMPPKPAPKPLLIHGASPVVSLPQPGQLSIVRVDQPGDPIALDLPGKPVDLASRGVRLVPGGTYRASYGSSAIVFRVDAAAAETGSPLLRLIQF
ncbi:MAG TPA: hypothetical protein VMU85_22310 [Stellaceae bacterium]|nr:hypothetical protein [Stellaceae bacterium]